MKLWFKQLHRLIVDLREREAAQRNFLHAVYGGPDRFSGYERPAYLRRSRLAGLS